MTVSAGSQPSDSLFVQGTINVPFTRVRLTASTDGDVTVDSVTVERTGLMDDTAFSGVVLLDENGLRINQVSKSLSSTHTATINDNFVVKAGQTRDITIAGDAAADLSTRVGEIGYLALVSVNTSATVNGSLPITGAGHTANSSLGSKIGAVTLTTGSLDPAAGRTKEVGSTGYIFTSIKATVSNEDVVWKSATFNQSGSMGENDFENLVAIDDDGNTYPFTTNDSGKYYTADFGSGILIPKGKNAEISVRGDIIDGSARTTDFDIFRYEDLVFHGQTYDYDIKPTAQNSNDSSTDDDGTFQSTNPVWDAYEAYTNNGSLSVSKDNSVASGNVVADGDGVELGAFEFEAKGEPISFTQWVLTLATTDSDSGGENALIQNVTVYDENGSVVAGPQDANSAGNAVTFTDNVTVPTGKNIFTVKSDLNSNWETNDTIITSFIPSSALTSVTGDTTGNSITPTPASTVTGPTMTVKAGSLTISRSGSFASTTQITNGTDVEVGRYVLSGSGSGDDVKVTVAKLVKRTNAGDKLSRLRLKDVTDSNNPILLTSGSNEASLANNIKETLTFNLDSDKEVVVTKGSSKIIGLFADVSSTATTGSYYQFNLHDGGTAAAWTVKTVNDGNTVTATAQDLAAGGVTLKANGGYTVALDASAPKETWYTDGATGVTLNVLKFKATSEDISITDLRLQLDTTGSSTGADIKNLELWNGSTLVASKVDPAFNNGVEDFDLSIGDFVIPKDDSDGVKLTIKADLDPIGTNRPIAGRLVGVDWDAGGFATNQKGTGAESGATIATDTHSDVNGNGIMSFEAIPIVSKLPIPQTTLTSGNAVLYKFSVKAVGGNVAVRKFTFKIATSGITAFNSSLPNLTLYTDEGEQFGAATGSAASLLTYDANYDGSNQLVVRMYADTTDLTNNWLVIPNGVTRVFELFADITTDGTSDSVSTTLVGDNARSPRLTLTGSGERTMANVSLIDADTRHSELGIGWANGASVASSSSFIWSDLSSEATTTHSVDTADWINGFKVSGLPTTGLTASTLSN